MAMGAALATGVRDLENQGCALLQHAPLFLVFFVGGTMEDALASTFTIGLVVLLATSILWSLDVGISHWRAHRRGKRKALDREIRFIERSIKRSSEKGNDTDV